MKICPFCGVKIPDEATTCGYCSKFLTKEPVEGRKAQAEAFRKSGHSRNLYWDKTKITLRKLLFSSEGRVPRSILLKFYFACIAFSLAMRMVMSFLSSFSQVSESIISLIFLFINLVFLLFFLVAFIFLIIKRCHDLNWSGWRVLWVLVPIANIIVVFYWFVMPGTSGPNEYGPDPNIESNEGRVILS